jgi:hypothetical protein
MSATVHSETNFMRFVTRKGIRSKTLKLGHHAVNGLHLCTGYGPASQSECLILGTQVR